MAKTLVRYFFAGLLAFLTTQPVAASARVSQPVSIVWCTEAEQQAPLERRAVRSSPSGQPFVSLYVSRPQSSPESAALFQRPPPPSFFFS